MTDLGAHLRTGQHDDEQSQGSHEQPELHAPTVFRDIRHELLQQVDVAEAFQLTLPLAHQNESDKCQYRYQHQQVEVYGVFKSEHNVLSF